MVYGSTLGLTTPSKSTLTKELKVLPLKILQLLHLMLQYCDNISNKIVIAQCIKSDPCSKCDAVCEPILKSLQVDTFIVEAVDLGRLENIIIGHDGKGEESAWFLEKVSVKEGADAKHKYIFTYGR